jgi:hypothetical protein
MRTDTRYNTTVAIAREDLDFLRGIQLDESAAKRRKIPLGEVISWAVTALAEKRALAEMAHHARPS